MLYIMLAVPCVILDPVMSMFHYTIVIEHRDDFVYAPIQ